MSRAAPPPSSSSQRGIMEFYRSWTAARPEPQRFSTSWWFLWAIRFTVFGITGSSSVYFVRPLLKQFLGLEGAVSGLCRSARWVARARPGEKGPSALLRLDFHGPP